MRRSSNKKKFIIMLFVLLIVGLGIGYAVLTQQLSINNIVSYSSMKWDVGFSEVEDYGGSIVSTSSISNDGKTITVNCDFGLSTSQESCIVKATITNNSTFDIGLTDDPIITYDDTYIHTLTFKWDNHPTYYQWAVRKGDFIEKESYQDVILTVKTKNLKADMLPSNVMSIPITISLNFEEWGGEELPSVADLPILGSTMCTFSGDGLVIVNPNELECNEDFAPIMRGLSTTAKTLTFQDEINEPDDAIGSLDLSYFGNGKVMAYFTINEEYSTDEQIYLDIYIQGDGKLYACPDMSWWFVWGNSLEEINGLEVLDTSMTFTMEGMFAYVGFSSDNISVDLSSLDTSSVEVMSRMFEFFGINDTDLTIDVSNFDTSNVTDMSWMFVYSAAASEVVSFDLYNFDTSNVVDMKGMLAVTGVSNPTFTLDVINFDTSKVTDMSGMFSMAGKSSTVFTVDVSRFDTSEVTNMESMFDDTGSGSTKFVTSITIRNPNIQSYNSMFLDTAVNDGCKITVNYTSETEELVDAIIASTDAKSNVVKGKLVD